MEDIQKIILPFFSIVETAGITFFAYLPYPRYRHCTYSKKSYTLLNTRVEPGSNKSVLLYNVGVAFQGPHNRLLLLTTFCSAKPPEVNTATHALLHLNLFNAPLFTPPKKFPFPLNFSLHPPTPTEDSLLSVWPKTVG